MPSLLLKADTRERRVYSRSDLRTNRQRPGINDYDVSRSESDILITCSDSIDTHDFSRNGSEDNAAITASDKAELEEQDMLNGNLERLDGMISRLEGMIREGEATLRAGVR